MLSSCRTYLSQLSSMGALVGDFYLLLGREFRSAPLPEDVRLGTPKQCYSNAGRLALERPDFAYCEGFALRAGLFPMHHAWCLDEAGTVVDPTWAYDAANEYLGVALDSDFLLDSLDRTGVWGVLAEMVPPELVQRDPRTYLHPAWVPELAQLHAYTAKLQSVGIPRVSQLRT